jgi:hypothetical protein
MRSTRRPREAGEKGVPAGAEGAEDRRHGLPQVLQRGRTRVDRAERVHQHDLPVDPREMGAEEGFDDLALVGLVTAGEFAGERAARRLARGQRGEGDGGAALEVAGQEEPAGRAVAEPRGAGGGEVVGPAARKGGGHGLVQFRGRIGGAQRGEEGCCERVAAGFGPGQRGARPGREIEIEKREVQQPFAGIVDDVEMHRPRPRDRAEKPRGPDPERQAQFRHRAGAVGPVRVGPVMAAR